MKRLSVLVLTLSLIVNLAAPAGAVFAVDELQGIELDDTAVVEAAGVLPAEVSEVVNDDVTTIATPTEPSSMSEEVYLETALEEA